MAFGLDSRSAGSTHLVKTLDGIQVRLGDDARYRWVMLVPEVAGTSELHDLGTADQHRLMTLATRLGAWLKGDTGADKVNTAAIGNIVPQLHLHIVARHDGDAAWPAPIWGQGEPQAMDDSMRNMRIEKLAGFLPHRRQRMHLSTRSAMPPCGARPRPPGNSPAPRSTSRTATFISPPPRRHRRRHGSISKVVRGWSSLPSTPAS